MLNSRIHITDRDFALEEGLLPPSLSKGKVKEQFYRLGEIAGVNPKVLSVIFNDLTSNVDEVLQLINHSFLSERLKRNYFQAYLSRLKKIKEI